MSHKVFQTFAIDYFKGAISKEQQEKWFEQYLRNPHDGMFAIFDESGAFIGCNSIYDIFTDGTAKFGRLIVDPRFSGKGYGYKATNAAIQVVKNQFRLKILTIEAYEKNTQQ